MKNGEVLKEKSRMMIFDCIKMPAIYVRDYCTKCIHMVGTNEHDRLYLDDDGYIQYFNLQNGCGTPDEYDFVLDPEGHDQNNLPFTEEEQIMYGLSNMDAYFGGVDLKKHKALLKEQKKQNEELPKTLEWIFSKDNKEEK